MIDKLTYSGFNRYRIKIIVSMNQYKIFTLNRNRARSIC